MIFPVFGQQGNGELIATVQNGAWNGVVVGQTAKLTGSTDFSVELSIDPAGSVLRGRSVEFADGRCVEYGLTCTRL